MIMFSLPLSYLHPVKLAVTTALLSHDKHSKSKTNSQLHEFDVDNLHA